jgi:glycosyltransferase involved in cell wall biosynthesis
MPVQYSIVVPAFNEESVLPETYLRLTSVMDSLEEPYEMIFVNDGSTDMTLSILRDLNRKDPRVKILDFSRNFGHQAAITAGMEHARGEAVIVMDADLQDPPELIPAFIEKWREGYEVVYGVREERDGESLFKKASAALFYRFMRVMTDIQIPVDAGDFRLLDRSVVEVFRHSIKERNRFIRGLTSWVGFRQTGVPYPRGARVAGQTKYPFKKMLRFSTDALISFSDVPLRMASYLGFAVAGLSFFYLFYVVLLKFVSDRPVAGWSSLIAVVLFLGGVQLIFLGVIGGYISRINDEVKQRPLYIVKRIIE